MNNLKMNTHAPIGIVGLGLMGSSIATALILYGQKVVGLSPVNSKIDSEAPDRIKKSLAECKREGLTKKGSDELMEKIHFTAEYKDLGECWLVMECVVEDLVTKREVYSKIEDNVSATLSSILE